MNRRTLLLPTVFGALLACGLLASSADASAEAGKLKIFTMAYPTGFPDLDPSTSFSNDGAVLANVYESLTRYQPAADGKPARIEPLLAKSWAVAPDGLTWTFKLREGVKFHDGSELDARAVKLSIERTQKLKGGAAFIWSALKGIDTPDAHTVVMKLKYPQPMDATAAAGYAAWIISPKSVGQQGPWFNAGHDAGSGPYRIERYAPGQRVILGKFDKYWGGWRPGSFDKVVFDVTEDVTLAQRKIETGAADWTYGIPYDNLKQLAAQPALRVVSNPSFETLFGQYNVKRKPLDNKQVRQALSLAFPYDDVILAATQRLGVRARGVVPLGVPGYDKDAPVPSFDLAKARALLAQAGYAKGGISLTMTYPTSDALIGQAAELWKASLAKLGVTLNLQPMAWEAQWQLGKSDPAKAQDIFSMYWWPTFITPYDYLFNLFHSEPKPNFNLGYYSNPAFDQKLDAANAQLGAKPQQAEAGFRDAQRMVIADAAAVFMLNKPNVHIVRASIKGYRDNPAYGHVVFVYQLSR